MAVIIKIGQKSNTRKVRLELDLRKSMSGLSDAGAPLASPRDALNSSRSSVSRLSSAMSSSARLSGRGSVDASVGTPRGVGFAAADSEPRPADSPKGGRPFEKYT